MKTYLLMCLVSLAVIGGGTLSASAQGTSAFTYQSRLTDNGAPANGGFTLQFTLHSSETGNNLVGAPITVTTNVVNGFFTTDLDFGDTVFNGEPRWLEISIAPAELAMGAPVPGGVQARAANPTPLSRVPVRASPQASYARRAMTAVTADTTSTATNAISAQKAQVAVTAGTATNAITAQRAQVAVTAQTADSATIATNAHLLGGFGAAAFAPASGSANYVARGGDTMTGQLNLPVNGLNVGNQLVVSGGRIGIGTATPSKTLDVRDDASQSGSIHVGGTGPNGDPKLISFGDGDFVHIGENGADDRMELKASTFHFTGGNVGIGTATPASPLHVFGGITTGVDFGSAGSITFRPPDGFAHFHIDNGPAGGRPLGVLRFSYGVNPGDATVISMTQQGRVGIGRMPTANPFEVEGQASKSTAGSWLANSDRRIKHDVQVITGALDTVAKVRLVSFRYTDEYRTSHPAVEDRRYLNVVAQEFREVFPEHVTSSGEKLSDGSEILQVDAWPLTVYSAAAIQELNRKVEQQQTEITELKKALNELKALANAFARQPNGGAQ